MMKQSYSRSCHKDVSPNTFLENLQQNSLNTFFLLFRYIILFMSNALKKSKSLQNALIHAEIFSRFFSHFRNFLLPDKHFGWSPRT